MKRLFSLLLALALCAALCAGALASESLLIDDAGLLGAAEAGALETTLRELQASTGYDVVVVTVQSLGGKTVADYAQDFYTTGGYAENGVMFLIAMNERRWDISSYGEGEYKFAAGRREYIGDKVQPLLSDGDYYGAFSAFAEQVQGFFDGMSSGDLDDTELPVEPMSFLAVVIAFAVGLVAALIVTGVMRGKLKTVRPRDSAGDYVRAGSMNLRAQSDSFLYSNVTRTERPRNDSHSSGGGGGSSSSGNHTSGSF